ncbi:MAG: CBS domain-containing protein [Chloroflexota bacterium]|nr:MAG: CBS domain-containing protein [Chloroflexota bacterium]
MLVNERMSAPVITVEPDLPIMEALNLMKTNRIRRTPVVDKDGKLLGIISDKDLLDASPSDATSLSVWEINYLLSQIKVSEIMTKEVLTVSEDTPIEEVARIMADNKIGGIPIMSEGSVVGLITETDLFKIFLELMGARVDGVRVTAMVPERRGELALITQAVAKAGGSFVSFTQFAGKSEANREVVFKVRGLDEAQVIEQVTPHVEQIIDARTCC